MAERVTFYEYDMNLIITDFVKIEIEIRKRKCSSVYKTYQINISNSKEEKKIKIASTSINENWLYKSHLFPSKCKIIWLQNGRKKNTSSLIQNNRSFMSFLDNISPMVEIECRLCQVQSTRKISSSVWLYSYWGRH